MSKSFFKIKVKRKAVRALEHLPKHYKLKVLEVLKKLRITLVLSRNYDAEKLKGFEDASQDPYR